MDEDDADADDVADGYGIDMDDCWECRLFKSENSFASSVQLARLGRWKSIYVDMSITTQ